MNKMHQAAKIAFATLAIYLVIKLLPSFIMGGNAIYMNRSLSNFLPFLFSFGITILYVWLLIHFLIIKRDKLAVKIVGETDLPTPDNYFAWIPFAYRLACMTAGLFFLYYIVWDIAAAMSRYIMIKSSTPEMGTRQMFSGGFSHINISSLIMLPIAIYLLCGAPHFVRWQVKKTLAICSEFSENEAGTKSNDLQTGE